MKTISVINYELGPALTACYCAVLAVCAVILILA